MQWLRDDNRIYVFERIESKSKHVMIIIIIVFIIIATLLL